MPIYVNSVEITDDEVHREMQYHPASSLEEARYLAAQALVIRQLLLQEAERQGFLKENAEDKENAITALLEKEITVPEADEATCQRYYQHNRFRFKDKKSGDILPFDLVQEHIFTYLQTRSMRTGIGQYIKVLAGRSNIAGFQLEAADSALVQ